jgi:dTDP-4-amino-4,6-dideoxygalactose transaminase
MDQRPMRPIAMSAPDIQPEDIALVVQALQSGQLSLGPFLNRLEHEFAAYVGTRHAVAVSSGTAGLHLCICAADIGPGDEVITTPFSFVASANCILYERATPVFVDINEASMTPDPAHVAAAVTDRTRAVLAVHVFGQPCQMDDLNAVCRRHGLLLIEDACEAIGAEFLDRRVGTFGQAAVFGFYPNKQMTMGEGGIVTTDDPRWAARLRSLRNQGRDEMGTWLHHPHLGFNYRLDEMSAALGLSQLSRIDRMLASRARVAASYRERLQDVPGVTLFSPMPTTTRLSWFVLIVRLAEWIARDEVIAHLHEFGIPSRTYFSPIHLQPFLRERFGYREGDFPVTERVANTTLALPFHANMAEAEIAHVADCLKRAVQRSSR